MRAFLLAVVVLCAAPAFAQQAVQRSESPKPGDLITNPTFALWANFAVGTSVTQKEAVTLADGTIIESQITARLVSKHPDKVTVETTLVPLDAARRAGVVDETKTLTTYSSKVKFEDFQTPESSGYSVTTGKETLDLNGKRIDTEWVEASSTNSDGSITERDWYATDIPGGLVKQTVTKKKGAEMTSQSMLELVDVKAKPEVKKP
jgi:hypothetical protein